MLWSDKRPNTPTIWIPSVIVRQRGPLTFLVDVGQGQLWKQHLDHLKQFTSDDDFGPSLTPSSSLNDAEPPKNETSTATTSSSPRHEQSPASEPSQTETERRYPS